MTEKHLPKQFDRGNGFLLKQFDIYSVTRRRMPFRFGLIWATVGMIYETHPYPSPENGF